MVMWEYYIHYSQSFGQIDVNSLKGTICKVFGLKYAKPLKPY